MPPMLESATGKQQAITSDALSPRALIMLGMVSVGCWQVLCHEAAISVLT